VEGLRLTRFVGVLAPSVISVYSPGASSSTCEAGSSKFVYPLERAIAHQEVLLSSGGAPLLWVRV